MGVIPPRPSRGEDMNASPHQAMHIHTEWTEKQALRGAGKGMSRAGKLQKDIEVTANSLTGQEASGLGCTGI